MAPREAIIAYLRDPLRDGQWRHIETIQGTLKGRQWLGRTVPMPRLRQHLRELERAGLIESKAAGGYWRST